MGTPSKEFRVLLDCLSQTLGLPRDSQPLDHPEDLDHQYLADLIQYHQVLPQIQGILKQNKIVDLPTAFLDERKIEMEQIIRKNLWLAAQLVTVHSSLQKHNIPCLCLKGPLLALQLYKNLVLRHQGDLDLLIAPEEYTKTRSCLMELGYEYAFPSASQWSQAQEQTFLTLHGQIPFWRPKLGPVIDIHIRWFRNSHAYPVPFDQAWVSRQTLMLQGQSLFVPDPVHTLLFLCVHGAKHRWEKMFWLIDIVKWCQIYPDADWSDIFQEARRLQCQRSLAQALLLAQHLLGLRIPQGTEDSVYREPGIPWLVSRVVQNLEDQEIDAPSRGNLESSNHTSLSELISELYYMTRLQQNLSYKLACFSHLRTSARDWELLQLPAAFLGLYYPLRPLLYLLRLFRVGSKH